MGGVYTHLKSFIGKKFGLPGMLLGGGPEGAEGGPNEYSEYPYLCTLCGRCGIVCPAYIDTKELRIALRGFMVKKGQYPDIMARLAENLDRVHNVLGEPSEDRPMWMRDWLKSPRIDTKKKKRM